MDALSGVAVDIFLSWLNRERRGGFQINEQSPLVAVDGERRLAFAVHLLYEPDADPAWTRRRKAVTAQLRAAAPPLSLWLPPATDLPHGDRTDFLRRVTEAANALAPGQRGQVEFPVALTLKKLSDEASYVHVTGGLAPHWARLTGRAFGQYELDTTAIHRLPEPESRVNELLDWIVLLGNGMKAGATSEVKAEDAWTLCRTAGGDWTAIAGAPPREDVSNGTAVRRRLRQALRAAAAELAPLDATARALVLTGIFRSMDEENATIALRGCDPALYTAYDAIVLIADGQCRPLFTRPSAFGL